MYKGHPVTGSKDSTTFNAINGLLWYMHLPGIVAAGKTDTSLVDDRLLSHFADIAGSSTSSWLPLDGKSFSTITRLVHLLSQNNAAYVYCYWYRDYQQKLPT